MAGHTPYRRKQYLLIAKCVRNVKMPDDVRKALLKEFMLMLRETTPLYDENAFRKTAQDPDYRDFLGDYWNEPSKEV